LRLCRARGRRPGQSGCPAHVRRCRRRWCSLLSSGYFPWGRGLRLWVAAPIYDL
jgi:SH3-like domain-containing protein